MEDIHKSHAKDINYMQVVVGYVDYFILPIFIYINDVNTYMTYNLRLM